MTMTTFKVALSAGLKKLANSEIRHADIPSCTLTEQSVRELFGGSWSRARRKLGINSDDVDRQSRQRFGKSWAEVKQDMTVALTSLCDSGYNYGLAALVRQLMVSGGTGNWMTNRYLQVLYLHAVHTEPPIGPFGRPVPTPAQMEEFTGHILREVDGFMSCHDFEHLSETDPSFWELLGLAPVIVPAEVYTVLRSHRRYLPQLTAVQASMQKALREHVIATLRKSQEIDEGINDFLSKDPNS